MALTVEEKRERDAAYQRRKRIKKKYLEEGCQRTLVYRPETVHKLAYLAEMIGLDDNEVNQAAVAVLFDLLTGGMVSSESGGSSEASSSTKSDAHILLLRKKNIYTGDPALAKDLEEEEDGSLALTPYNASNLSVQKILAKQGQAQRRDEGKDIDPTLIETATTIACELLAMIRQEMPDFKSGVPIAPATWKGPIIDMLDRDGRDPEEMSAIIAWIGKHSDWDVRTVLRPHSFRKQFDRLAICYRQWCKKRAQLEAKAAKKVQRKGKATKKDVRKHDEASQTKQTDALAEKTRRFFEEQERRIAEHKARLAAGQVVPPAIEGNSEGGDVLATTTTHCNVAPTINGIMAQIKARSAANANVN